MLFATKLQMPIFLLVTLKATLVVDGDARIYIVGKRIASEGVVHIHVFICWGVVFWLFLPSANIGVVVVFPITIVVFMGTLNWREYPFV